MPTETLVEQRNSVAHSWNVEDRITFREITDMIIPFLRMICACVCRLCVCSAFNLNSEYQLFENQQPIKIIDNRIICFNNQNKQISIGDYIIYESDEITKIAYSIRKITPYTNVTKLIENGVSPKAIQIRLGHKNIEETMHIYPHCSGKMEDNAVEIANSIF